MSATVLRRFEPVNKELLILLSLFGIAGLLNVLTDAQRMVLGFYSLPTVAAAYLHGRRHAVLTAYGSVLLALLVTALPTFRSGDWLFHQPRQLAELIAWAGTLLVTAYLMGTACERKTTEVNELRQTYAGAAALLRSSIAKDEGLERPSHPVSVYAARIAARLDQRQADGDAREALIVAVADVYDALTSDRPYRKAMSPVDARDIIEKGGGTQFDPLVVDAFLSAFQHGDMEVRMPSTAVA